MKTIRIGDVYLVKFGRGRRERVRPCRVVANYGAGFIVVNLATGRRFRIRDWRRIGRPAATQVIVSEVCRYA